MDKVSKVKAAPVYSPELAESITIPLHGQAIKIVSIKDGLVQFDFANDERRSLAQGERWLKLYLKDGVLPKGTRLIRTVNDCLVTVEILSIADGTYGIDIDCDDEAVEVDLPNTVPFKQLIRWYMQPDAAAPMRLPDHPAYTPDEDDPDYAAGVEAGRTAALVEVVSQSEEVARLKHAAADSAETIDILKNENAALTAANARLELKAQIVKGVKYEYEAAVDVRIPDVNAKFKTGGWEPIHWQYDSSGLKLSVVYRKPVETDPLPAPRPEASASAGTRRHLTTNQHAGGSSGPPYTKGCNHDD